jgi:type IV pilus assembly protein PilF
MNRSNLFKAVSLLLLSLSLFVGCQSKAALLKREKESDSHYKLGVAHLSENVPNLQKAYIEFLMATGINPKNKEAYYGLGHVYAQRQEYLKAIDAFQKTVSLDPKFSDAYNYMGNVYEQLGRDSEAILAYQEAIKNLLYATPQFPHWKLGLLYLRQKKYEESLTEFNEVLRIEPNNSDVFDKMGETYLEMGQVDKARALFEQSVQVFPTGYGAHYKLASLYLKEGSNEKAIEAFKKVIEHAPSSPEASESKKRLEELQ